jgi:hypothetical protein
MKSTVGVPIHTDTLQRLIEHLCQHDEMQDLAEAVSVAIDGWLGAQAGNGSAAAPETVRGYQWKTLFLPEGTVLRSWSYGEANLARVEGDRIMHAGRAVSPNQFAQAFARTTRNAWTDLFIKRPNDKQFRLACVLRRELAAPSPAMPPHGPLLAAAGGDPLAAPAQARDPTQGSGWTLPERRKLRFRIEDVAFE